MPDLTDAISQDVSDPVESPKTPRELAMERIASDHLTRVSGEFDGDIDQDIDPEDPDADQVALQTSPPAPSVVKVKVDGQELEVTEDELVRTYQKNAAADRRLEEAAATLREANRRLALADEQLQAQTQQQHSAPAATDELQAEVKTVLAKMYGGDEDGAAEALTSLLAKTRGGDQPTPAPAIDLDQLTLQIQENMSIDTAFAAVKADYPDLISDPDLEALTASKVSRAIASGAPRAQAILDSAAEVYRLIGKEPQGRSKPPTTGRMDNKQRLDLVKPASGVAATRSTPTEENVSDVIAEMANRRLGQTMPRRVA